MNVAVQVVVGVAAVAAGLWVGVLMSHPAMRVPVADHGRLASADRRRVARQWPFAVWIVLAMLCQGLDWPATAWSVRVLLLGGLPAVVGYAAGRWARSRAAARATAA